MKDCTHCGGSGKEPDWEAVGAAARKARLKKGLGLREAARQADISASYAVVIEDGGGSWSKRTQRYLKVAGVAQGETR